MENARNINGTFKSGVKPWNKGLSGVVKAWNKGKRKIPFTKKLCTKCGVEYQRSQKSGDKAWLKRQFCSKSCKSKGNTYLLGRKHSEETREKMRKANPRGELNRNWNPNREEIKSNKDRHYCAKYIEWRRKIFERDGFKCRIESDECVTYLEAHHILTWKEYPELRYQLNNGITLCRVHHPRKRTEEKRLASYFQELVSVSR